MSFQLFSFSMPLAEKPHGAGILMPLSNLPVGASALVTRVGCPRPVSTRLMEMGLLPGTPVSVTRVAPLGDPMEIRVRDYSLSIRKAEALQVEVTRLALAGAPDGSPGPRG